jgi:beta-phosphoglucomutase
MFEAVIFDWDGTLADTKSVIVISFQKTLKEIGITIPADYIERRIGIGASDTFREILKEAKRPIDEALVKRLVENKSQIQIDLKDQVQLFAGARELLEALQGKIKVGLASMNSRSVIQTLIHATGLEGYFQTIVTGDMVLHSKPDPEIFLKCAQQLVALPQHCVVVEDSIFGVKAAKNGKMGCIGVTTGVYSRVELDKENPDLIVSSLKGSEALKFILS